MTDELRAKDIYRDLPPRVVVGDALTRRVGARGWEPPWFATGSRLFEKYGIPDPWDPDAPAAGALGLGEVGIAAPRREPAPHATPKAATPSGPKLPNVPAAPQRMPSIPGMPDAAPREGKPAPRIGEMRADDTDKLKAASAAKARADALAKAAERRPRETPTSKHALAKLPVRPQAGETATSAARPAASAAAPARPGTVAPTGAASPPRPGGAPTPGRPGAGGGSGGAGGAGGPGGPARPESGSSVPVPVRAPPPQFGPPKPYAPSAMQARSNSSEPSSQAPRPSRLAMAAQRRPLSDGPEELPEPPASPSRPPVGFFGMGGGAIDEDDAPPRATFVVAPIEETVSSPMVSPEPSPPAARSEPVRAEAVRAEPVRTEPVGTEPVRSEPARAPAPVTPPQPSPAARPTTPTASPAPPPRPVAPAPTMATTPRSAPPASAPMPPRPAAASATPSPPARPGAPPRPGGAGGLDDLFGMGATEGRVRIPKKTEGEAAPAARRPMVSTAEELAKSGVDRRPPPPKPPVVVPTPGAAGAAADPESDE